MTVHAIEHAHPGVPIALPIDHLSIGGATGWFDRARAILIDLLLLTAVVYSIPLAILAVGIPIALVLQALLWLARMII